MTHFVSSRKGLVIFDENKADITRILGGQFFGMARLAKKVFLFGYKGERKDDDSNGFIVSFTYSDEGKFSNLRLEIEGLDNGCHQMTIWNGHLYIVETYVQRLVKIRIGDNNCLDPSSKEIMYLWPRALKNHLTKDGNEEYLHVNAITVQDGRFFFMCPYLGRKNPKPSKIQVWSPIDWTLIDEYELDRWFCHDLVIVGHEIYFCDCFCTVCKLNLVTRQVTDVFRVPEAPNNNRSLCRGLSMSKDGEFIAALSWVGKCGLFKESRFFATEDEVAATYITRIDGNDYNNTDSDLRKSYVTTYSPNAIPFFRGLVEPFSKLFAHVQTIKINHDKWRLPSLEHRIPFTRMEDFLNPALDETWTDLEPYINGKEKIVFRYHPEMDSSEFISENLMESEDYKLSGGMYYYPKDHGMGWHTNEKQLGGHPDTPWRQYLVKTTGGTFFFYSHPISRKIHAVHDIDASVNAFRLTPAPDFFWHAIGSVTGNRFSIGFRTKKI